MNNLRSTPGLRPVTMTLFPTLDSLDEAVNFASSKLPIFSRNELHSVLMVYQNTLLNEIHKQTLN